MIGPDLENRAPRRVGQPAAARECTHATDFPACDLSQVEHECERVVQGSLLLHPLKTGEFT